MIKVCHMRFIRAAGAAFRLAKLDSRARERPMHTSCASCITSGMFAQIETNIVHRLYLQFIRCFYHPHESFLLLHVLLATVSCVTNDCGLTRRIESNSGMLTGPSRKHEFLDINRIDRGDPTIFRLPPITGPLLKETTPRKVTSSFRFSTRS